MFVVPAPGLTIPDPVLRDFLPAEGREVEPSEYWSRRAAEGSVSVNPPAPPVVSDAAEPS